VFGGLIAGAGTIGANGGVYLLALTWSPGISALATRFAFRRNRIGNGRRSAAAESGRMLFHVSESAWPRR
jgi:hypothetical protein